MVNPFPTLLSLSFFAPVLLRIVVGIIFIRFGVRTLGGNFHEEALALEYFGVLPRKLLVYCIGAIQIGGGLMLLVGFLTQIAGLVMGVGSLIAAVLAASQSDVYSYTPTYFLLLAVICISLISFGAGAFAIDLPF
jgi:putative oxidoreductase